MKKVLILITLFTTILIAEADLYPVKISDKTGYIDNTGEVVIKAQFTEADFFSEDMAKVRIGDKYGFINPDGDIDVAQAQPLELLGRIPGRDQRN